MIRRYSEEEIPQLLRIWEAAAIIAHPFLDEPFHQFVKTAMAETYLPNSNTWVYENEQGIIGFISMNGDEIGGLFVDPGHQSKGIGGQLVKHMIPKHAPLEVEVFKRNTIGLPFYVKHGFEVINEYFHEESGQDVLRLRLQEKSILHKS